MAILTKHEFRDRLTLAADLARKFAAGLDHCPSELPTNYIFDILWTGDNEEEDARSAEITFLGGRRLKVSDLKNIKGYQAAEYLWVDGKVPAWINIGVSNFTLDTTIFELIHSRDLRVADIDLLPPDYRASKGNRLMPFRLRGPAPESWASRNDV